MGPALAILPTMTTVVLAWLAVVAACTGAALFGQTARTAPRLPLGARLPTRVRRRTGLAVSMAGPWLALLGGAGTAAVTGLWLPAAVGALAGVLLVSAVGLVLVPQ